MINDSSAFSLQSGKLAQYNLSRLIERIERAGYLERRACEDDGRGQLIVITERKCNLTLVHAVPAPAWMRRAIAAQARASSRSSA
jgi:DNA-binding MarR family transcriptional regulator